MSVNAKSCEELSMRTAKELKDFWWAHRLAPKATLLYKYGLLFFYKSHCFIIITSRTSHICRKLHPVDKFIQGSGEQ